MILVETSLISCRARKSAENQTSGRRVGATKNKTEDAENKSAEELTRSLPATLFGDKIT